MADPNVQNGQVAYNAPDGQGNNKSSIDFGSPSGYTAGDQIRVDYHHKRVLIEKARERYFSPFADTMTMP